MPARRVTQGDPNRLTVTLDSGDRAEMDRICQKLDRSLGWLVRAAIREYLERTASRPETE
jgi:hypothetical protein